MLFELINTLAPTDFHCFSQFNRYFAICISQIDLIFCSVPTPPPHSMDNEAFATLRARLGLPLSEIIRPTSLANYIGQRHLINESDGAISNFLFMGYIPSMILYGPPGVGKTTLANIIANDTGYVLVELSATDATVAELRELSSLIRGENRKRLRRGETRLKVAVFIDEIHRFSKNQQDFLLPFIEAGDFVFIGATTVDPAKRIRRAILSRCQLFELQHLSNEEVIEVLRKAVLYENIRRKVLSNLEFITFEDGAFQVVADYSHGDTRTAINFIELISSRYNSSDHTIGSNHSKLTFSVDDVKQVVRSLTKARFGLTNDENIPLFVQLFNCMNGRILYDQVALNNPHPLVTYKHVMGSLIVTIKNAKVLNTLVEHEVPPLRSSEFAKYLDWDLETKKWGDRAREWASQMDYSDDSDVEPGQIYSDSDSDDIAFSSRVCRISAPSFRASAAVHTLLQLLAKGESEFFILKQLILFVCMYILPDTPELVKVVAVLKALRHSTVDYTKLLSLLVERLSGLPKSYEISFVKVIRQIKEYCSRQTAVPELTPHIEDIEIVFDETLAKQLLEDIDESALRQSYHFNFSAVDENQIEGYTLGWETTLVDDVIK